MAVPGGIVRQRAHDLDAVPHIELGRLEAVRVQRELDAVALGRDLLDGEQQSSSKTTLPHVLADPQRLFQQVPPRVHPYTPRRTGRCHRSS
jgi:hypothetical protein